MKDPLDGPRPYEILGIDAEASPLDATRAYFAIQGDLSKLGQRRAASEARDRMTRTDCRLEDELFYYSRDDIDAFGAYLQSETGGEARESVLPAVDSSPRPADPDESVKAKIETTIGECDWLAEFVEKYLHALPMEFPE